MAYDELLAQRLRDLLEGDECVTEKKMFGGVGFMVEGHLAVGASSSGDLMVRVDPTSSSEWLDGDKVRHMEMDDKPLHGWLLVDIGEVRDDEALRRWVERGSTFVRSMPPKA